MPTKMKLKKLQRKVEDALQTVADGISAQMTEESFEAFGDIDVQLYLHERVNNFFDCLFIF